MLQAVGASHVVRGRIVRQRAPLSSTARCRARGHAVARDATAASGAARPRRSVVAAALFTTYGIF